MGIQIGKILGVQTQPIKAAERKPFVGKNELLPTYGADKGSSLVHPESRTNYSASENCGTKVYFLA